MKGPSPLHASPERTSDFIDNLSAEMALFFMWDTGKKQEGSCEFLIDNPANSLYHQKVSAAWKSLAAGKREGDG